MHQFKAHIPHSKIWTVVVGIVIVAILGAHLLGFKYFSSLVSASGYLWPLFAAAVFVVAWHMWKFRSLHVSNSDTDVSNADVIARDGLHWHPEITIYVKGVRQQIPQMGLTNMDMSALHMMHKQMQMKHMHDGPNDQGVIHLKFEGLVLRRDITLGQFFKKWGKDMRSLGSSIRMTVNRVENKEFENYVMHDKDKIEIHYE